MRNDKKWLDYVITVPAAVLCTPLLAGIAIWIKLDSPGPVFFKQKRVGIHQTYFEILKFRTMRSDAPKDVPTHLLKDPEQYITRSGKFLRATSLDELPQIFNILKGDMSLVGPRPALWNQYNLLKEREKYGANDVLPGLTGWAQTHGRDTISVQEKAKLDGYYVEHQSIWMDLWCMVLTVSAVLRRDGIREGAVPEENVEKRKKTEGNADTTQRTKKIQNVDKMKKADKTQNVDKMKKAADINDARVSVIVATYRRTVELAEALESLGKQTWGALEIILVDDNADPVWNKRVDDLVQEFRKKYPVPLLYLVNEANQGSAASRNRGIEAASGDYITFLDDDDRYEKEKVAYQVKHMQKLNAQVSITDLALYREDGKLEEIRKREYLNPETIQEKEHLLAKHFLYHMTGTDTLMFRKDFLEKLGGFPPKDLGDEFYLMEKAIRMGGRISYLPRCDVKALVHRISPGMSSKEGKIQGENQLFRHKRKNWAKMTQTEKKQICMRHHMVLGYTYLRERKYGSFVKEGIRAFAYDPLACLKMVWKRK